MGREEIAAEVRALLVDRIESYEQLEVLVWLCRQGARGATLDTIASALRLPIETVQTALRELQAASLIGTHEGVGGFRCIGDEHQTRTFELLVRDYDERLIDVTRVMTASAMHRVRTETMRRFSDAFVVGGKKKDG